MTAGPTCPVERIDSPCPPSPVVARVEARNGSRTLASAQTTAGGAFTLTVPPGSYTVVVVGSGPFPRCPDTPVVVPPGTQATATIMCDTGIR